MDAQIGGHVLGALVVLEASSFDSGRKLQRVRGVDGEECAGSARLVTEGRGEMVGVGK